MKGRRTVIWVGQIVLTIAVLVFFGRALAGRWSEFRAMEVRLHPQIGWIVLSALTVWVTYAFLIEAWRRLVVGWRYRLPFLRAARVWTLANLGRYLPGKVWAVAGLAVLATREGVAGWAATAAAGVMQALAVGTGIAVAVAGVPGSASPLALGAASLAAVVTVAAVMWRPTVRVLERVSSGEEVHPLAPGVVGTATVTTLLSWVGYGVAFWMLARGVLGPTALTVRAAIGVFAAGYITGLLAIFAPGGVGVREAVLLGLAAPWVGSGGAVVLTVASRVLLTFTEAGAALFGAALGRGQGRGRGRGHDKEHELAHS